MINGLESINSIKNKLYKKMKIKNVLLWILLASGTVTFAQDDECRRHKKIAETAYKVKDYEKVTMAYNNALNICESLEMAYFKPFIYSIKKAMRNADDNAVKAAYLDTLIHVYEQAQVQHGLQKDWQSYLAYSYLSQSKPGYMQKADEAYQIGVHHEGATINEGYLKQYYSNLYNLWVQEDDEDKKAAYKKRLITEYFVLSEYISKGEMSIEIIDFMNVYLDKAVKDCESILPEIHAFMKELPQDLEKKKLTVNNFMEMLEKKKCTSSKEYAMLVDTIIVIDPTVGAVLAKAKLLVAQDKTSEAIEVYREALEMTDDETVISDIELAIAEIYFRKRNYKAAYNAGKNISGENSKKGYAIAAKSVNALMNDCGGSTFMRKSNNYYAVQLAEKSGDASLINAYKNQCPSQTDLFNETREEGEEVTLECWGRTVKIVLY